ncbi:HIT family protein [Pseudomonas sp. P5_109]|uniref:HIT family protein n=1 Tax=Pseudomonas sp. P5_109 TaxID=3043441 RepID=UPI002A3688D7|nr:HIT family protein [Pseudomonas sp. P5_109]WPN29902.1 HIT family protein [Pseudomonas sp. P5_109]
MKEDCVFCRELIGRKDTNFARLYPEFSSRVIAETDDLVVFPCIGQLTPGHSLVVTKAHYSNFAEAFNALSDLAIQLKSALENANEFLGFKSKDTLYFEHGAITADHGGCGIYHAHLHLVPQAGGVKIGSVSGSDPQSFKSLMDAYFAIDGAKPYALIGSEQSGFTTESLNVALPSQTIRRKVASELGCPVWDWREAGQEKGMIDLLSRKLA